MSTIKKTILLSTTVRNNFDIDQIKKMVSQYSNEEYNYKAVAKKGNYVSIPDLDIVLSLHTKKVGGRNSFIAQQLGATIPANVGKRIIQKIDPSIEKGKLKADYHQFVFKSLATIGIDISDYGDVSPFKSIEEYAECKLSLSNHFNSPSNFVVQDGKVVFFGKGFGAAAGEVTLMLSTIRALDSDIEIYLTGMPETKVENSTSVSKNIKNYLDSINVKQISTFGESKSYKKEDEHVDSIRDQATFKFELRELFHEKACFLCGLDQESHIIAAHIKRVADIKREKISDEEKYLQATDPENGFWLCRNHDIAYENGEMYFTLGGDLKFRNLTDKALKIYKQDLLITKIPEIYMSDKRRIYLKEHLKRIELK